MGPSGKLLLMGDVTEAELEEAFREQARAMAEAGADAVVVETMTDLAEACIAVRAVRDAGLPVVASMVFDSGKNKDRTMMGATPERAAAQLEAAGAQAVGANCGIGIASYVEICRRLRAATRLPVWIKPNAGLPEMVDGRAVYRTSAETFAAHVPALLQAGVNYVGGCCGTTPEFVRAMRAVLDTRE
jgi:methionine synthase I (cobalamin-dependent)